MNIHFLKQIEQYKQGGRLLIVGDQSDIFLDECKNPRWKVCACESVSRLKSTEEPFDVIVLATLFDAQESLKRGLYEARALLKPAGLIYFSVMNNRSIVASLKNLCKRQQRVAKSQTLSKKKLREWLVESGFKAQKTFSNTQRNKVPAISVVAYKTARLNDIEQIKEEEVPASAEKEISVFVVMPAYNAEKTLKRTLDDIPHGLVDSVLLVDDCSTDNTVQVAQALGMTVIQHKKNRGYGGNQKTCYQAALEAGADIIVMVHPDYQYDPAAISRLIEPIKQGEADAVFGSRMMKGGALEGGMPLWKHNANVLLTAFENVMLGTYLTEYHTGFRAYSAELLRNVRFEENSDNFVFDTEIIVQALLKGFKIEETPIKTRYFEEASQIKFLPCVKYGFGILWTLLKFKLHSKRIFQFKQFQ